MIGRLRDLELRENFGVYVWEVQGEIIRVSSFEKKAVEIGKIYEFQVVNVKGKDGKTYLNFDKNVEVKEVLKPFIDVRDKRIVRQACLKAASNITAMGIGTEKIKYENVESETKRLAKAFEDWVFQ